MSAKQAIVISVGKMAPVVCYLVLPYLELPHIVSVSSGQPGVFTVGRKLVHATQYFVIY